jgi:hypothetical protein
LNGGGDVDTNEAVGRKRVKRGDVYANIDSASVQTAMQGKYGGYNRLSVTSNVWHKNNPSEASVLFGFDSFEITKSSLYAFFEIQHEEPTASRLSEKSLTTIEKWIVTLTWMQTGKLQSELAQMFGTSDTSISIAIVEWA